MKKVSDAFFDALSHDGSICRDCHCGRTHFAAYGNEGCFEAGELEELRRKAQADPDHYIEQDCSSITIAYIDGKGFACNCPCNGLAKYESFILKHRDEILDYLKARHTEQFKVLKAFNGKLLDLAAITAEVDKVHIPE